MAQSDPNDTVYKSKNLSKWFAIASLLLLFAVVWAVLEDFDRDWKYYSRQNQKIAAAIGERRLLEAKQAMDQSKVQALQAEIKAKEKELASLVDEFDKAIKHREDEYYKANSAYQIAKGQLDADLFILETKIKKQDPSAPKLREAYRKKALNVDALKQKADAAERVKNEALTKKDDLLANQKKLTSEIQKLRSEVERFEKIIAQNETSIGNLIRNAPVVDFISPTVKINQVVLPHLKDDYFFNKVPRVDRCMTCHATIDKPGFEEFPQPFTTHPKLNLMVGENSAHPVAKVGCTVCHAGVPQSVSFNGAAHTPQDVKQEAEWKEKHGFYYNKHINTPMVPLQLTEGKCIQCHATESRLKDAPTYNAGMALIEKAGCYGCHKFGDYFEKVSQERKPGPSLLRVSSKLSQDWVRKWLWEPKSFRPSTLMPQYWQNFNNSDPESIARGKVEVEAITHYLFAKSGKYEPLKLASQSQGDAARGKELVGSIGCLGCHAVSDFPRKNVDDPKAPGYMDPRIPMHGPELNQMGSKVSKEWLYSWLMNPKHYWEGTVMPSMKLSSAEANDIAAYLLEKRNPDFEAMQVPQADDKVRDAVVRGYLETSLPRKEAQTKLASMSLDEKKLFLGERMISHYGCYGCHAISGFENAPKIGAELTYEGSKDVSKFAFEAVNIPHYSRPAWIYTKVRTPRIWDVGKERDFEGKARMPHFGWTDAQTTAITAIVIGHENKKVDDEAIHKVDGRQEWINAGQRVVNRYNCVGCHALDPGQNGGYILGHYTDDTTMGPPLLYTQGRKTQAEWLYNYLMNPNVMIRPWIKVRMPQFQLSGESASTITKYFAGKDKAVYPFVESHSKVLSAEEQRLGAQMVEKLACLTCHGVVKPGGDVSAAAPHFVNIKYRLNGDWVKDWLHDPQAIMPGTRMPTLWPSTNDEDPKAPRVGVEGILGGDAEKQIELMRDYLFQYPGTPELPTKRGALGSELSETPSEVPPTKAPSGAKKSAQKGGSNKRAAL